ncbi:methyltransferase domain-containing protein [Euzebyella marina]|uniref:Methyltransferase domain-containing protein n=1 Tax=Euzebyella marina TaxID=1761453 RepID=A0A3G2L7A0_9FLAO|nr:methyltransferase domain-containing protein [Euzebyella marina]AYN68128.1 methyltransferase domain-containing protein [Euzebyella marina]
MINLKNRFKGEELMDGKNIPKATLLPVFEDINRCNRILGGTKITLSHLNQNINRFDKESYTILDVGCGDGEMLRKVVLQARKQNRKVKCYGVDLNETALAIAREKSKEYPEIVFLNQNIFDWENLNIPVDFVLCTLTLHHIKEFQLSAFLKKLAQIPSIALIINDLQRSTWAYYLFELFSTIFIKTEMARKDGATSIKRGFLRKELKEMSKGLTFVEHQIKWQWAFRYSWVMTRKNKQNI